MNRSRAKREGFILAMLLSFRSVRRRDFSAMDRANCWLQKRSIRANQSIPIPRQSRTAKPARQVIPPPNSQTLRFFFNERRRALSFSLIIHFFSLTRTDVEFLNDRMLRLLPKARCLFETKEIRCNTTFLVRCWTSLDYGRRDRRFWNASWKSRPARMTFRGFCAAHSLTVSDSDDFHRWLPCFRSAEKCPEHLLIDVTLLRANV